MQDGAKCAHKSKNKRKDTKNSEKIVDAESDWAAVHAEALMLVDCTYDDTYKCIQIGRKHIACTTVGYSKREWKQRGMKYAMP